MHFEETPTVDVPIYNYSYFAMKNHAKATNFSDLLSQSKLVLTLLFHAIATSFRCVWQMLKLSVNIIRWLIHLLTPEYRPTQWESSKRVSSGMNISPIEVFAMTVCVVSLGSYLW